MRIGYVSRTIAEVLERGVGLSYYPENNYAKIEEALVNSGWKPVNCTTFKKRLAKEVMNAYETVKVFYNTSTKKHLAFLGYLKSSKSGCDIVASDPTLWLRILGDNE